MGYRKLTLWIKQNLSIFFSVSFTFYLAINYFLGSKSVDMGYPKQEMGQVFLNSANQAGYILLINVLVSYDLFPIWI